MTKVFSSVEIIPLPAEHHGKVFTRKAIWLCNASAIILLVAFLGGIIIIAWGANNLQKAGADSTSRTTGVGACILGSLCATAALIALVVDPFLGANRRLRNAFNAELSRRYGKLVEPDDPDAIFVEIIPRINWGKVKLENATDIGLLVVDKWRKELRFEGDKARWRVPAAALVRCELESFLMGESEIKVRVHCAVVYAMHNDGIWEMPLRERTKLGLFASLSKERATRISDAVAQIAGKK